MKSTKAISNPYKKAREPEGVGQKRIRPWDSRSGAAASSDAVPSNPTGPVSKADLRPPLPPDAPGGSLNDDSFDCGINWDEALKTLESQSVFDATTTTTNKSTSKSNNLPYATSAQEQLKSSKTIKDSSTSFLTGASPSQIQENNLAVNKKKAGTNALETLRPASWSVTTTTSKSAAPPHAQPMGSLSRSNSITSQSGDPDQEGLPRALRFTSKDVAAVRDEYQKDLVKNAEIGSTLLNGWELFSHQKRAILKALAMRRCILALDMGLGKTLIGCVYAKAFVKTMQTHVVVICPVSLREEWKRTMENAVGLVVQDLGGTGTSKKKAKAKTDGPAPSVSIHSWSKIPDSIGETYGEYIVIGDEAHSIQSMEAARTRDTLKLVSGDFCEGVLLLTGTPMKNGKPSNLFPLLRAVKHPLGRHQRAYETHFCEGREIYFGARRVWRAAGAANLDQLRKLAKSHMLHLTKDACLKDLPPLSRVFVKVPVSSRRQIQHNNALQDMVKLYESRSRGADDRVFDKIMGAVQKVRVVGSLAKVEAAVEQAKQILMEEPAVVVFASFQEATRQVHQQLAEAGWKGEILTGETPPSKRQAMVDNFQKGLSPVFCATFGAGGVGLTLTAAHSIILLDRPWTPGDAHQAEDRVRRIGQTKPVRSIWLRSFDLDQQIDRILEQKQQTMSAVLTEQSPGSGEQQAAPRLSIFEMLKSIVPASNDHLTQTTMLQYSQG